jgi:hypothetical protein
MSFAPQGFSLHDSPIPASVTGGNWGIVVHVELEPASGAPPIWHE